MGDGEGHKYIEILRVYTQSTHPAWRKSCELNVIDEEFILLDE